MRMLDEEGLISPELRAFIENTNDIVFVKNLDFIYIASSRSHALNSVRCNGVEEVIGKTDFELFRDAALAEKYRENDKALLQSGKEMDEFEEDYPDCNDPKRRCLTIKYVIHDQNGNPAAILGICHDIGEKAEKEIERRREIDNYIIDALGKQFFAAHYADLKTHKYVPVRSVEYARKMLEGCETIEQAFELFIQTLVKREYQEKMRRFCESETIAQRVKGKTHIDCDYLSKVAMGWCQASFYPTEWDEQGDVTHVLFAVSTIDKERARSIEEGISYKKNLDGIFNVVPSGVAVYEWDGDKLKFLNTNQRYRDLFGYDILKEGDVPTYSPFHPADLVGYKKAITKALTETHHLEYVFRIWDKEKQYYRWIQNSAVAKPKEDGTSIVYAIFTDITKQKNLEQSYLERLRVLQKSNADALCMADVNLTKNRFCNLQAEGIIKQYCESADTLDEVMMRSSYTVIDPEEQEQYRDIFRCEAMLKRFEQGETHIQFEHFYRVNEKHTMMVETVFDLIKEPITGDVIGIAYAKDLNKTNVSNILLNVALEKDYPMAALIYVDTGEYYYYEVDCGNYCVHKQDYWKEVYKRIANSVSDQQLEKLRNEFTCKRVVTYLEEHDEFTYAFNGKYRGKSGRYEVKFQYVDKKHQLLLGLFRDITDESLYQQYKYDSEHDELTGLYNRNKVFAKARELLNTYPDEQFIMLHCDIRHFHLYNTFFGEAEGNRLLCEIADLMRNMGWDYDYWAYGRIESDVFCAFFPIDPGHFEEHVRYFLKEITKFRKDFLITPAIGAYWVADTQMSIEEMFAYATIAAKSGKTNLYGLISRYDEEMDQNLKDTQQITSEMHTAIEQEEFEVYLQPKYSLRSDKLVGAEALVRWKHPQRGMISPGKFIPAFEKNGFIAELDKYMWEHVCQILRRWQKEEKTLYPVSVNISRVSMYSQETVPFLKSLIEKYRIAPKYLELELTESAYMDDPEELKRMLKELQEFGFKILMDDFGSGYSSLNTLRDLPVDILKLDMKFLSTKKGDNRGLAVLSSVVRMSKLLNLPIVAEGVETQEQADYLRSIGCEYVQGFLYAKPMPTADYEGLLAEEESDKAEKSVEDTQATILASEKLILEDPLVSFGVLEYHKEKFAYLRTNKRFLSEFDLIENLAPVSQVFRNHMDDESYQILLQTFTNTAEKKCDSVCSIKWLADDGTMRRYHGYVHYHGNIGNYADLTVTFINVTKIDIFGIL